MVLCQWLVYHASLGSKFFELHREQAGEQTTWKLIYHYPYRVRQIPRENIKVWTGAVSWSRRSMRHALVLETLDGRQFRSTGIHPEVFEEQAVHLRRWGIDIPTK